MNIVLFDQPEIRTSLLPFTFTRPVSDIRVGILTIAEKWRKWLDSDISYMTESYLANKYPKVSGNDNLSINGAVCPNIQLVDSENQKRENSIFHQLMNGIVHSGL